MTLTQAVQPPVYNKLKAGIINGRLNVSIRPMNDRKSLMHLHTMLVHRRKMVALGKLRAQIKADTESKKTPELKRWDEIENTPSRQGGWNNKTTRPQL